MNIATLVLLLSCTWSVVAGQSHFRHILITNDDGIGDADRLRALALGVKPYADRVSIIVSVFDRSGTSNHSLYGKHQSLFEVTCRYIDEQNRIAAYTTPMNPADCVIIGLLGFFGEDKPDLVLSGINGGSNIGPDWFGSGTIGAVRTAAFLGTKAVALSGFDDADPTAFTVLPAWIGSFITSGLIDDLPHMSYLSISFPKGPVKDIKGVRLNARRITKTNAIKYELKRIHGPDITALNQATVWVLEKQAAPAPVATDLDEADLAAGYIVVTPMTIDENDAPLLDAMRQKANLLPQPLNSG